MPPPLRTAWLARSSTLALAGALAAAALAAGCQKGGAPGNAALPSSPPPPPAALPLTNAAPPAAEAPPATALPSGPPLRRARLSRPEDRYAFADRADQMSYGFGDAPPDYAFDYQGGRPWAWQNENG